MPTDDENAAGRSDPEVGFEQGAAGPPWEPRPAGPSDALSNDEIRDAWAAVLGLPESERVRRTELPGRDGARMLEG